MNPKRSFGYANVMSTLAVLLALTALVTGTAISKNSNDSGAPPPNSVGTKQVKPNALGPQDLGANSVTSSEVANDAVTSEEVAPDAILNQNLAPNSVTGNNLAPNSVTPSAVQDSSYTPLALENGWSSPDGYYQAAYTVEPDGLVRLRGAIAGGTDVEFARLPAGIRPSKILQTAIYAACPSGVNTDGLYIEGPLSANTGKMYVSRTDCGIYSLDGVTFQP
jgi:hypothetical protein